MNKKILAAAACALFLFPFSARADWMESAEARFFTEGGTSAARISLSSEQFLKVSVSPAEADFRRGKECDRFRDARHQYG